MAVLMNVIIPDIIYTIQRQRFKCIAPFSCSHSISLTFALAAGFLQDFLYLHISSPINVLPVCKGRGHVFFQNALPYYVTIL